MAMMKAKMERQLVSNSQRVRIVQLSDHGLVDAWLSGVLLKSTE